MSCPSRFTLALLPALFTTPLCGAEPEQHAIQAKAPTADEVGLQVASGRELVLYAGELEPVLLERFALGEEGRSLLHLLVSSRLLDHLGRERGWRIGSDEIDASWNRLDREIRAGGGEGLAKEIEDQGLSLSEFRDFLRLSILQERLAREALGIPEDEEVKGQQQEIWLDEELGRRNLEILAPPWEGGHVARCSEFAISAEEFAAFLRRRLPTEEIEEAAWHLLLLKGIERKMLDVAQEPRRQAVLTEMDRRRRRHAQDNPGLGFEELLGAQGRTVEGMQRDPSVRIAALTRLWVDRTFGPEGLRRTFDEERSKFEGLFGKAVRAHLLFLVASRHRNELNPRTYDEADQELARILSTIGNTDDFAALAERFSEEPKTRETQGELGWVTRADPRVPDVLRDALFRFVDSGAEVPPEGTALGPLRLDSGCAVLWVSGLRASPSWEFMSEHVHSELRRRFIADILPRNETRLGGG